MLLEILRIKLKFVLNFKRSLSSVYDSVHTGIPDFKLNEYQFFHYCTEPNILFDLVYFRSMGA